MGRRLVTPLAFAIAVAIAAPGAHAVTAPPATPKAACGPGSRPEPGLQGRVGAEEVASGRAAKGYLCNTVELGHEGKTGGFRVHRFVDKAGHECAYYDTTLLFPLNAQNLGDQLTGVGVLDMSNPSKPVRTDTLLTPAMQSPHESLNFNTKRGLLVAVLGTAIFYPGHVDVYDVNADCRHPELQASLPVAFLGHESGFTPDGLTYYATSLDDGDVTAIDLTNPRTPVPLTVFRSFSHGMNLSEDGNRAYIGARGVGLQIMDVSEIQARKLNPQVHEVSTLGWDTLSIPQTAIPVTIDGKPYAVEIDEFSVNTRGDAFPAENGPIVGAARIIDIADETKPKVVSDIRLEVNQPENRAQIAGDPGATSFVQGYGGHYCSVPKRKDPGIVACSFILSGLRVFDVRDPRKPKEIAYFVAPPGPSPGSGERSNYAMSAPDFVPERGEIWYSDGNSGFHAVKVTNDVWPFKSGGTPGCLRPSTIGFKLHRVEGTRVVRVEAFANGKRVLKRTGDDIKRVELTGLKRGGKLNVRIVATHDTGAKVVSTRSWNGCRKGKPKVRVVPRR